SVEGGPYYEQNCCAKLPFEQSYISSFSNAYCYVLRICFVNDRVDITMGEKEERMMITGLHTVVDKFCLGCGSIVGWKCVRLILILPFSEL
ncbi:hypothetical protein Tsubulata_047852, partial [Turnera subulata]